jgi:hypothetical protein
MADYKEKDPGQQQDVDREMQGGSKHEQQEAPGRNPDGGKSTSGQQGADKNKQEEPDQQGGYSSGEKGDREETRR